MPRKVDWKAVLESADYDEDFDFIDLSVPETPGWIIRAIDECAEADGRSRAEWIRQLFKQMFEADKARYMPKDWKAEPPKPKPVLPKRMQLAERVRELEKVM